MQIDKLKTAWKQVKCANNLEPLDLVEIHSIMNGQHLEIKQSRLSRSLIINLILFTVLAICVQGG